MKPDRFAHMAHMLWLEYRASPWVDERNKWAALEQRVETLLLRQHRAMVRMVKTEQRRHVSGSISVTNADVDRHGLRGYHKACRDILAALARYRKGTR